MRYFYKNNIGFTLIESVVAVSVLVTALVGPMQIAARSIAVQRSAKNTLIASNLAQEGLELVRWYRDNNVQQWILAGASDPAEHWIDGLFSNCNNVWCGIDEKMFQADIDGGVVGFQAPSLPVCGGTNNNCALMFNDTKRQYELCTPGCTPTNFSRRIKIENTWNNDTTSVPDINPDEVQVLVTVEWNDGQGLKTFSARTRMHAW